MLPLQTRLYEMHNLKHADAETKEFKKFTFSTRSFNTYDPHFFVKDHYARVQFHGSMGRVIGLRKTHGDIVTASPGPMSCSSSLWNG